MPFVISCGVITFILYLNLHPQFRPDKKTLLHKVVLHPLVKTTLRSIYFVDRKEVEWRRKKQGGSHHTITIQTPNVTYHHPKSRSIGSTTIRSSLHCVVIHPLRQKILMLAQQKSALLAHLTRKKTRALVVVVDHKLYPLRLFISSSYVIHLN
jgi:hypothetical protein